MNTKNVINVPTKKEIIVHEKDPVILAGRIYENTPLGKDVLLMRIQHNGVLLYSTWVKDLLVPINTKCKLTIEYGAEGWAEDIILEEIGSDCGWKVRIKKFFKNCCDFLSRTGL
ncbi:MAG: hypothetical protein CME61_00460 [Halobacteriovoraceae bacterium]|nr:hypothetical protein [Halobacteriovoraceae bacterium]|tara:strand:+ start:1948 stop:2289 length:342 start_codon:yes stop_codon:yes gene_type:complete